MSEPALDLSEIVDLYKEDARRMIQRMEDALSRWEEVVQGGAARQELRRLSHQLRGSGRTYGFCNVTRFSKALESIMLKIENNKVPANARVREAIHAKIKRLEAAFTATLSGPGRS